MKIVINRCYGGFGLSQKAIKKLYKMNDKHIKKMSFKKYFGNKYREEEIESHLRTCDIPTINNDIMLIDEHRDYNNRTCENLIKVLKEMKSKTNGEGAELVVREIPDDVVWEIDEYDGAETINEQHRSW